MGRIDVLERHLGEAEELRAEKQAHVERAPEGLAARLSLQTLDGHIAQLRSELRHAWEERAVEVLRFRLLGHSEQQRGMVPLPLLARLSKHMSDALHAIAQKRKTGRSVKRISKSIIKQLNLNLAGVSPGSTVLTIVGETSPDLFGYSVLDESLKDTFNLLNAEEDEEFADRVSELGIRGAREVRYLLAAMEQEDLTLELSWRTPREELISWYGDRQRIHEVVRRLGTYESREPEEIRLSGKVITLSLKGRFELEADGRVISGKFPDRLLDAMQALHIGEQVEATVERTVIVNTMTQSEKVEYTLLRIHPTGQVEVDGETSPN